jgi:hypothetical protein
LVIGKAQQRRHETHSLRARVYNLEVDAHRLIARVNDLEGKMEIQEAKMEIHGSAGGVPRGARHEPAAAIRPHGIATNWA